jgi:hypothetical protein
MIIVIPKILLVILIGIYAIRTSWFLFSGVFSPLTPVAAIVFVICLFAFHRPPETTGTWFYSLVAIYVIGAIANASLLFSTAPVYSNTTNMTFSAVSLTCFIILGLMQISAVVRAS